MLQINSTLLTDCDRTEQKEDRRTRRAGKDMSRDGRPGRERHHRRTEAFHRSHSGTTPSTTQQTANMNERLNNVYCHIAARRLDCDNKNTNAKQK